MTPPLTGPFGRTVCAMVTPFTDDGRLDLDAAQALADRLVGEGRCDGLVLNGTTGEAPTTSDFEKSDLIRAVRDAVAGRARVTAGVGTNDTRHTVELARAAEAAGADGLLVVTPYYSRPPQDDVARHFLTVADAVGLPVMLYDIPGRTGTRIEVDTMLRLAEHPRVAGVKDCSFDLLGSAKVIARTDLLYYSGAEELNLPLRAVGAAGYVSTVANAAGALLAAALDAFDAGAPEEAVRHHQRALPLVELMMSSGLPGTVTAKALLTALGLPGGGPVRAPLRVAGAEWGAELRKAYEEAVGAPGL
ncbi:4-hydroxy-tetrahydrodipicolinate synthase [Streptomyces caatingaensis]|uniref:4-hydroxy-tetrahydrodipicolinate synthase n=1 Tax=Streptomyces caatingaensis TaxID=1678637 RepID=A0A0K9XH32_9ACTN|nr:4-hydroxy-tetrahydrodipicolinate synthase [Streptomyces caatingaensis]KNB52573.1 dihydrodipicolinate synthase [Streptomyces caatingaensis]